MFNVLWPSTCSKLWWYTEKVCLSPMQSVVSVVPLNRVDHRRCHLCAWTGRILLHPFNGQKTKCFKNSSKWRQVRLAEKHNHVNTPTPASTLLKINLGFSSADNTVGLLQAQSRKSSIQFSTPVSKVIPNAKVIGMGLFWPNDHTHKYHNISYHIWLVELCW